MSGDRWDMRTVEDIGCVFPRSLSEALALMAAPDTRGRALAGGTDLMVQWASGAAPLCERAVSLLAIPELRGIRDEGGRVVVGATVTHAELRASPVVRRGLPALAAAAATIGGAQIQARGTIAGNVANASPAGDLAPALLVSGGSVVVASVRGEREIPLDRFYAGYRKVDLQEDEIIIRFRLPMKRPEEREMFRKLGPRAAQAISKVMGACRGRAEVGVVRLLAVAVGSVAPVPVRLRGFEEWAIGRRVDGAMLEEAEARASEEVRPIDDIRSTAAYRGWVTGRVVREFLEQLLAG